MEIKQMIVIFIIAMVLLAIIATIALFALAKYLAKKG
jgi:hypothetical protein